MHCDVHTHIKPVHMIGETSPSNSRHTCNCGGEEVWTYIGHTHITTATTAAIPGEKMRWVCLNIDNFESSSLGLFKRRRCPYASSHTCKEGIENMAHPEPEQLEKGRCFLTWAGPSHARHHALPAVQCRPVKPFSRALKHASMQHHPTYPVSSHEHERHCQDDDGEASIHAWRRRLGKAIRGRGRHRGRRSAHGKSHSSSGCRRPPPSGIRQQELNSIWLTSTHHKPERVNLQVGTTTVLRCGSNGEHRSRHSRSFPDRIDAAVHL